VDASLVQARGAGGTICYGLLRSVTVHTLESADRWRLDAARSRYLDAVLARTGELADRLVTSERSATLRRIDHEMPHVRAAFGQVCSGEEVHRSTATTALEAAVALSDYWLGRHPAEGMEWLGRLIVAADPPAGLRAEAQIRRGHLAYWLTDFAAATDILTEARQIFVGLGDRLGEGRALRRLGAVAAATDDVVAARKLLEESIVRLDEAGVEVETGTSLLHLGSLLADMGVVAAALPAWSGPSLSRRQAATRWPGATPSPL